MDETYYIVRTYKRTGYILRAQQFFNLEDARKSYYSIEVDDYITRKEIDLIMNDGTPDEIIESEEYEDDEEDIDDDDICDCCIKGWDKENEFGRCHCWCSSCGELLRDCKYKCM